MRPLAWVWVPCSCSSHTIVLRGSQGAFRMQIWGPVYWIRNSGVPPGICALVSRECGMEGSTGVGALREGQALNSRPHPGNQRDAFLQSDDPRGKQGLSPAGRRGAEGAGQPAAPPVTTRVVGAGRQGRRPCCWLSFLSWVGSPWSLTSSVPPAPRGHGHDGQGGGLCHTWEPPGRPPCLPLVQWGP